MNPRQAGFTLIEVIVTMAILGMVAGLVLVRQPWHSAGLDVRATVTALTDALRLARSRAIAQDRTVSVSIGGDAFSVDGEAPRRLPPGERLGTERFVFLPDGGSTGGAVQLAAGQRRITISVNWLTGRVRAAELSAAAR